MAAKSPLETSGIIQEEEALDIRSLRESRGLTLDDISRTTRISLQNLQAIEAGNYHVLPAPVFTRSFLQTYARLLDLDAERLLTPYEQYLSTAKPRARKNNEVFQGSEICFPRGLSIAGAILLLLAVLGLFIYFYFESRADVSMNRVVMPTMHSEPLVNQPSSEQATVIHENSASIREGEGGNNDGAGDNRETLNGVPTVATNTGKPETVIGHTSPSPLLVITAKEKTWLRITEDGAPAYQVMLYPGEKIERSALTYLIDVGNAGGITVEYQGKQLDELGGQGEVLHLRLPAGGAATLRPDIH